MDFDFTDIAQTMAAMPPAPPKPAGKGSTWGGLLSAPLRGLGEASAQVLGTAADIGSAWRHARDATPEQRRAMDAGGVPVEQFSSDLGDSLRDRGREFRPDPMTAGVAEQLLYGFSRAGSKIVGGTLLAGPAGALAAGIEEGVSAADDLRREGVALEARSKVGAIQGAALAAAVLPVAGPTLKATAGLYLAGGPGGFIAQQAATRAVLKDAGYDEIAQRYDPLDPVGLALSALVPLPFAAWGAARSLRGSTPKAAPAAADASMPPVAVAERAVPREVVDAAMVHNLTLLRDAHEATSPAKMAAEVARPVVTETPAFKKWFGASKLVDAEGLPAIFYHGTAADVAAFDVAKLSAEGIHLTSDPGKASTYAVSRAMDNGRGANVLPVYVVAEKIKDVPIITTDEIRQAVAEGFDAVRRDDHVVVMQPTQIKSAIGNSGLFDPESPSLTDPMPAAAIASTSGPIVPPGARQVQDILAASPDARDAMTQAMAAMESVRKSGGSVEQFLGSSGLPGPVQNLLVGLSEQGGAPQRVAALARALADQAAAKVDLLDATANAVERVRSLSDEQIRGTDKPPVAPKSELMLQQVADRVRQLEQQAPDMVVRTDADGHPVTLAEELAAVRREAAEGTDVELGTLDADLLRVAAECAMNLGAL